jgi:chloramphenicol-sensitive protein RarD
MPFAVGYLLWCADRGSGAFAHSGSLITVLLIGSGLVTAVPLFLFAYAARRLPYSTVGVLQYIGPSLQLVCGVWFFGERFDAARAAGFVLIWLALVVYALDGVLRARAANAARA